MGATNNRCDVIIFALWITVWVPSLVRCSWQSEAVDSEQPPAVAAELHYGGTKRQCAGLAVPHGWIWIASETNTLPGCGDYPRNVAVIRYVEGAPVGTKEEACTGSPLPPDWSLVGHKGEANRCDADYPDNVVIIQR